MTLEVKQRNIGLDVARGVAILLVVAGHVFEGQAKTVIYVFHMPFFFLVGGHLFRARDNLLALKRSFNKLIIPYAIFLAIFSLPEIIWAVEKSGFDDVFWRVRRLMLGGEALFAPLTIFWFTTCYFFTIVIYNFALNFLSTKIIWVGCLISAFLAYLFQYLFPLFWLPWAINVCAMSIPMFHIGATLGQSIFRPNPKLFFTFFGVSVVYVFAIVAADAPLMAMKGAHYGIPVLTLLAAISMSSVLSVLGRSLTRIPALCAPFAYCSRASMTIMYVHMPIKLVLLEAGLLDRWAQFLLIVVTSLACHSIFSLSSISRKLLLGQHSHIHILSKP